MAFSALHRHDTPVLGASGGALGLMAFCQCLMPLEKSLLFGLLPMQNRAMLLGLSAGSAYCATFAPDTGGLSHGAHLGGMAAGALGAAVLSRGRSLRLH